MKGKELVNAQKDEVTGVIETIMSSRHLHALNLS